MNPNQDNGDLSRHGATGHGLASDFATDAQHLHTLTIEDVAQIYQDAGLPRTPRTLQRYAEAGHLKAEKILTATGAKYLITPHSVDMHLQQLRQLDAQARLIATGRDLSRHTPMPSEGNGGVQHQAGHDQPRHVATPRDEPRQTGDDNQRQPQPETPDQPRQGATPQPPAVPGRAEVHATDDRYVRTLERENDFLRRQVETKDGQIKELTERSRETNMLIAGLQKMLSPLLGNGRSDQPHDLGR